MTVHHDASLPVYGWAPDPVGESPWRRAYEANQRAEIRREHEARHLADRVIASADEQWRTEYAVLDYRRAVAAEEYARAVYDVESQRREAERAQAG